MNETTQSAAAPLRISDVVPLRRMLGTDSVVIRVNPDGSFTPFERMPSLFFDRPIRRILTSNSPERFDDACAQAIELRQPVTFRPAEASRDEVMITPILDDDGSDCRFLVCWVRQSEALESATPTLAWADLQLADVVTRFRLRTDHESVVEAAPWWALTSDEALELWPHHAHVSALGLGHAVMEALIIDAVEAAATRGGGPAVRIDIPSADVLAGLVPVFHGAVRSSGIDPARVIVAIDVQLAVDPDLLPIIVHLRTMGLRIDIVGLDSLVATLQTVSDTSAQAPKAPLPSTVETGPWVASFDEACVCPAV